MMLLMNMMSYPTLIILTQMLPRPLLSSMHVSSIHFLKIQVSERIKYIPKDDAQKFCRLQSVVETFGD